MPCCHMYYEVPACIEPLALVCMLGLLHIVACVHMDGIGTCLRICLSHSHTYILNPVVVYDFEGMLISNKNAKCTRCAELEHTVALHLLE